jgi:hypothetical protein
VRVRCKQGQVRCDKPTVRFAITVRADLKDTHPGDTVMFCTPAGLGRQNIDNKIKIFITILVVGVLNYSSIVQH